MYVTIYIGDSLRNLADVKNSCDRLQRLIEKKASLKVNVGDVHTLLPLEVWILDLKPGIPDSLSCIK